MKVILKYKNRKLYDKELKHYISLKDVMGYVKTDVNFLVMDYNTKRDVTRETIQDTIHQFVELNEHLLKDLIKRELNK